MIKINCDEPVFTLLFLYQLWRPSLKPQWGQYRVLYTEPCFYSLKSGAVSTRYGGQTDAVFRMAGQHTISQTV